MVIVRCISLVEGLYFSDLYCLVDECTSSVKCVLKSNVLSTSYVTSDGERL